MPVLSNNLFSCPLARASADWPFSLSTISRNEQKVNLKRYFKIPSISVFSYVRAQGGGLCGENESSVTVFSRKKELFVLSVNLRCVFVLES